MYSFVHHESKQHIYTQTHRNIHKRTKMWNKIKTQLEEYPERLKVARVLIENGLSAKDDKIYLNQIEIPPVRIARVAGVDRRTVNETLNTIKENPELRMIFEEIRPAGHSLKRNRQTPQPRRFRNNPCKCKVARNPIQRRHVLNRAGLSIRQAIVDDPELSPEPKLTLIVEKKIPGELIPELLKISGVAKVSVY